MKAIKKTLSWLLVIAMIFSMVPAVYAEGSPEIAVGNGSVDISGGATTVQLPVTIVNNPGVAGFQMKISAPNGWTVTEIRVDTPSDDALDVYSIFCDLKTMFGMQIPMRRDSVSNGSAAETGRIVISDTTDITVDGYICWITLSVPAGLANGDYDVSLIPEHINNASATGVDKSGEFVFTTGTVTVTGGLSAEDMTPTVVNKSYNNLVDFVCPYIEGSDPMFGMPTCTYEVAVEGEISCAWYEIDAQGFAVPLEDGCFYVDAETGYFVCMPPHPELGQTRTYIAVVTNHYNDRDYASVPLQYTLTYAKSSVEAPAAVSGLIYTGEEQTGVTAGEGYTLSGTTSATNAGTYTAAAALNYGYIWADGTEADKTVEWVIAKAAARHVEHSFEIRYNQSGYYGYDPSFVESLLNDANTTVQFVSAEEANDKDNILSGITVEANAVDYLISSSEDKVGSTADLVITYSSNNYENGIFTVHITIIDRENVSDKLVFTAKEGPASYDLLNNTTLADYVTALDYSGVTVSGTPVVTYYLNGEVAALDTAITAAGTYEVKAVYEDDDQIGTLAITFTVAKAELDVSDAEWNLPSEGFTYGGDEKKVELTGLPEGVTATYTGNTGIDAGEYTASVTFALAEGYSAENYEIVGSVSDLEWCINKAVIDPIPTAVPNLVYTGETQEGVNFALGNGYGVVVSSCTQAVDAGTYTAIFAADPNHCWPADLENVNEVGEYTLEWTIAKAEIDISTLRWSNGTFTYDGTEKFVGLVTLPDTLTVRYEDHAAVNAGKYTARAIVEPIDKANYVTVGTVPEFNWVINKAAGVNIADSRTILFSNTETQTFTAEDILALLRVAAEETNEETRVEILGAEVPENAILSDAFTCIPGEGGYISFSLRELTKDHAGEEANIFVRYQTNNHEEGSVLLFVEVVDKHDVSDQITFEGGNAVYNGEKHTHETATVAAGLNGTITYKYSGNMTDAGLYLVTAIYDDAENHGEKTVPFMIIKAPVEVTGGTVVTKEYDGTTAAEIAEVTFSGLMNGDTIAAGDYIVSEAAFADANVGEDKAVTFTVALNEETVSNYVLWIDPPTADKCVVSATGTITARELGVSVDPINDQVYTGSPLTPEVKVTFTGLVGQDQADYTVEYTNNVNAGEATVTIADVDGGNYTFDTVTVTFKIAKAEGKELTKSISLRYNVTAEQTFTVEELTALVNDSNADTQAVINTLDIYGGEVLKTAELKDGNVVFTLRELSKEAAGKSATICAYYETNNHKESTLTLTVEVIDKNDVSDKLTFAAGSGTYTGEAHTYEKAKVASGYTGTITYAYSGNMTDAGTYTVTATYEDADNYGVVAAEYVINPAEIAFTDVQVAEKVYDGTADASVTVKLVGVKGENVAHAVTAAFATADAGANKSVNFTVALDGSVTNYTLKKTEGTAKGTIAAKEIGVLAEVEDQTYTGSALKPAVAVSSVDTVGGYQLVEGTDYTVKYENNTNAGTATVTVSPKVGSNYTFTAVEVDFDIAKATPVVTADNLTVGYTGAAIPAGKITGTATFNDKAIKGTWSWVAEAEGVNVGEYTAKVVFAPDNTNLNAVECDITVIITKATPSGEPVFTKVNTPGKTLADVEYNLDGMTPAGGILEWLDEESNAIADLSTVEVEANARYTWRYTPAEADLVNYEAKTGTVILYYYNPTPVAPSAPTYAVKIGTTENGTVSVDLDKAEEGETVTVTATPDEGYEIGSVSVMTYDGTAIDVVEGETGVYTFEMPAARVTVTVTFAEAVVEEFNFVDVPTGEWYYSYVEYAFQNGLMNGVSDTEFDPLGDTSRAMIVTVLWRMEGKPVVNYLMQFEDVDSGFWYTEAIRWAAAEGIVTGYSDTAFGPNDSITREQFAAILWRYAKYKGYDVSVGEDTNILSYEDAFAVSEYAIPAMQWACGAGLMQGDGINLTPKATATRAQAAALLQRFCENVAN